MTHAPASTSAAASLKKNGKTFWFASLFLPREIAADAAILYAFCRRVDDLADEHGEQRSTERLEVVRKELRAGRSEDAVVAALLAMAKRRNLDLAAAECLLNVLLQDCASDLCLEDEGALLRYCYGAAGTVGWMMAGVLQAEGAEARVQAIDLGIAMQLTNIARDVREDALMGRRYLPADWVDGLTPEQIGQVAPEAQIAAPIKAAMERTLLLADVFYGNAARGFQAIPSRARNGIRIAAATYRQIGVELRGHGYDYTRGRVVVALPAKLLVAAQVISGRSELERLPGSADVEHLHGALAGLPGFA